MPRIPIRPFLAALVLAGTATAVVTCTGAAASFAGQPSRGSGQSDYAAATGPASTSRVLPSARVVPAPPRPVRRPPVRPRRPSGDRFTSPRATGWQLAADRGWVGEQWTCLDELWTRESNWHVHVENASSGAYGIPQSLPADKMAAAGSDWRDNAVTQIRWGLSYIAATYGSPCSAWDHSQREGYY